jgi:hypothetical protein
VFDGDTWGLTLGADHVGNMTLLASRVDPTCPRDFS